MGKKKMTWSKAFKNTNSFWGLKADHTTIESSADWDEAYKKAQYIWGIKPDHALMKYAHIIPRGKVLDLGIGEGRNSIIFAKMGFDVEGVDASPIAIDRCLKKAKREKLNIKASVGDISDADITPGRYSLIIAAWVLNYYPQKEIKCVVENIKRGLKKNGYCYVGVFQKPDYYKDYYKDHKLYGEKLIKVGRNTYYSKKKDVTIHDFTKDEVLTLFDEFKLLYFFEGTELDLSHGKPHYHDYIEFLGQK